MPDESYTVRPARSADAAAVANLWAIMAEQHRAYDPDVWCWSADAVDRWREKYVEFVANDDMITPVTEGRGGELVGYAVARARDSSPIYATKRTGELWDLLVVPACRKRGIATSLMAEVFEQLSRRGAEDMTLHAALANPAAIRLYEKLGFRPVMYRLYKRLTDRDDAAAEDRPAAPAGYVVRPARAEDVDAAAEMWRLLVEQARTYPGRAWADLDEAVACWRARFAKEIEKADVAALVATDEAGRAVGFAEAKVTDSEAIFATDRIGEVWNAFVRPEHRGRGVGRDLLTEAFRRQRSRGCDDVVIHVDLPNDRAIRFYQALGLRPVMYRMHRRL